MSTKKTFIATAKIIRAQLDINDPLRVAICKDIARAFVAEYRADNPRFDVERFMTACGF